MPSLFFIILVAMTVDANTKDISIFGIGKLGLCLALNLEKSNFNVLGVDVSEEYVGKVNSKALKSTERGVEDLLKQSRNFRATTSTADGVAFSDNLFVFVATPSLPDGSYDHSQILGLAEKLKSLGKQETTKHLIIGCTTMPSFCDELQRDLGEYNYEISYNPEFIAQGTIIADQLEPDMVLIGSRKTEKAQDIIDIYKNLVKNDPSYHVMSPISAEICKISLNCFITTKIAFTNMVGDLATEVGAEPQKIMNAIGSDSRVGSKCTKYGHGYGGPCFPRDNRALGFFAKKNHCCIEISDATDNSNKEHLNFMVQNYDGPEEITFDSVSYKPESDIIEESQQLFYAVGLAKIGIHVTIRERPQVIEKLKGIYENLFEYEIR